MTEYITKDQAYDAAMDGISNHNPMSTVYIGEDIGGAIDAVPPAVVCCKDCKCLKYQRGIAIDGEFFEVMYCPKLDIQVKDNFYCAFGKRKEKEE